MHNSATLRDTCKSPTHSLAHRLEVEVGLNTAQIRLTNELLADHIQLFYPDHAEPGTTVHCAVSIDEPAGKPIQHCKVVPITLTLFSDADAEVYRALGSVQARAVKLYRMCWQAYQQKALLSQEDLSFLLCIDRSTVRDIIGRLNEQGHTVPTRGVIKDIGPEPSHKREIANLLGRGASTSQVRAMTNHSERAIGRYQLQFGLVIELQNRYPDAHHDERWMISGLSRKAYDTYLEVYQKLSALPHCLTHLQRIRAYYMLDPTAKGFQAASGKTTSPDPNRHLNQQCLTTALSQTIQKDLNATPRIADVVAADLMAIIEESFSLSTALRPGETVIYVDAYDPAYISGERSQNRPVKPVRVPLHTAQIKEIWRRTDIGVGRKMAHIAAIIASAVHEQGGIVGIANLAELMHTTASTLANHLRSLAIDLEIEAQTKGRLEDAGPTLTHKEWIVDLDKHGFTGEQIAWITRHAPISRDRYIETYRRAEAIMRLEGRVPEPKLLSRLIGIRISVAKQYVQLLQKYHQDGKNAQAPAPTLGHPQDQREEEAGV